MRPQFFKKFKHHLQLENVPGRNLILIHPVNDVLKKLEGSIAPVAHLTGIGKRSSFDFSFKKLFLVATKHLTEKKVFLTIKS